ncbi:MAG: hypothetical protein ACYC1D_19865 [Acidimicrobiales bacterium]
MPCTDESALLVPMDTCQVVTCAAAGGAKTTGRPIPSRLTVMQNTLKLRQ